MFRQFLQSMSTKLFMTAVHGTSRRKPVARKLEVEALESRQLMAAGLSAPILTPVADQGMTGRQDTVTATMVAFDANGDPLSVEVGAPGTAAYELDQRLGLTKPARTPLGAQRLRARWMHGAGGRTYGILPDGELRQWRGTLAQTRQRAALMARLDVGYFANPRLLYQAPAPAALPAEVGVHVIPFMTSPRTIDVLQLTVDPADSYLGKFGVEVSVSDGRATAVRSFAVTVAPPNQAPVLESIADQSMGHKEVRVLELSATDPDGDVITYAARVLPPDGEIGILSQVQVGVTDNRLKIDPRGFAGSFTVEVTASDGRLTSSTSFSVVTSDVTIDPEPMPVQPLESIGVQRLMAGESLKIRLPAGDADGNALSYSAKAQDASDPTFQAVYGRGPADGSAGAVEVTISGGELHFTPPAGSGGPFLVQVTADNGSSAETHKFVVNLIVPNPDYTKAALSPRDFSLWMLGAGRKLLRNGQAVAAEVARFAVSPQGDVYAQLSPAGNNSLFRLNTYVLQDLSGNYNARWVQIRDNISKFHMSGDGSLYVFWGGGSLGRYQVLPPAPVLGNGVTNVRPDPAGKWDLLADNVLDFDTSADGELGKVWLRLPDGTTETAIIGGDVEKFMIDTITAEPPPSQAPQTDAYGIVNGSGNVGPITEEYGDASAPTRVLGSVGRVEVFMIGQGGGIGSGTLLAWGGNRFVLTAAHVVESAGVPLQVDAFTQITFNPDNPLHGGAEVEHVYGREHFGGADLALLRLKDPMKRTGAQLPEDDLPVSRVLAVGYGKKSAGDESYSGGFGYAFIDDIREIDRQYSDFGPELPNTPFARGEQLVNEYKPANGEAAVAEGDSGGPDLVPRAITIEGRQYLRHTIVGVHSWMQDPNQDKVPAAGDETYSMRITSAITQRIKDVIGLAPALYAKFTLNVIDDGEAFLAGNGDWDVTLAVQHSGGVDTWDPPGNVSIGDNQSYVIPHQFFFPWNQGSLGVTFSGTERDSGSWLDTDEIIETLQKTIGVPQSWSDFGKTFRVGGRDGVDTEYTLDVVFGLDWVPTRN